MKSIMTLAVAGFFAYGTALACDGHKAAKGDYGYTKKNKTSKASATTKSSSTKKSVATAQAK